MSALAAGDAGGGLDGLFIDDARQAEVHDAHRTVPADHDVVRFEVAVDEPGGVRGRQAAPGREKTSSTSRQLRGCARTHTSSVWPSMNSIAM